MRSLIYLETANFTLKISFITTLLRMNNNESSAICTAVLAFVGWVESVQISFLSILDVCHVLISTLIKIIHNISIS